MQTDVKPILENCLAYHVLMNPIPWIGDPSAINFRAFLYGASIRATFMSPKLPEWRVSGVLSEKDFSLLQVAETGNPDLAIDWATAIEILHFSQADGFAYLRSEFLAWHSVNGFSSEEVGIWSRSPLEFWQYFLKRPGMYMGASDGWSLYCFLNGMSVGGDWLALPEMLRLDEIFDKLKDQSNSIYGTDFAAFRINDANKLLTDVGLMEP
jgi:hypothetical protein